MSYTFLLFIFDQNNNTIQFTYYILTSFIYFYIYVYVQVIYEDDKECVEEEDNNTTNEEDGVENVPGMSFSSIKEIKKAIKKQAAQTVQNSKIFKMKNKIEQIKDKKKAKRKKMLETKRQKWLKKKGKKK